MVVLKSACSQFYDSNTIHVIIKKAQLMLISQKNIGIGLIHLVGNFINDPLAMSDILYSRDKMAVFWGSQLYVELFTVVGRISGFFS